MVRNRWGTRLSENRFQLTTHGFHFYERGVENIFAGQADFAQLVKLYGDYGQHGYERYSPGRITEVTSKVRDHPPIPRTFAQVILRDRTLRSECK
jgi:hypothetical protein